MNWKKVFAVSLLAVGAAAMLGGCGDSDKAKSEGGKPTKIVAGLDDTFAPMGFRDDKGEITGFDVDMAKAISKEIGVEIEFKPIDWNSKETELSSGRIDCIWNGFTKTPEREEKMDFTKPYMHNDQIFVVLKDSPIQTAADLKGKKVCGQEGSTGEAAMNKNTELKDSFAEFKTYPDFTSCYMDLDAGRMDAIVVDSVLADYYMQKAEGKYRALAEPVSSESFVVAVKKGNTELVNLLNEGMKKVIDSGEAAKISEKWFGRNVIVNE
jgi:polar amino acid transport system substrate-binding protein